MLVDVIAQVFNQFRHKMSAHRLMSAALNFYAAGSEISGENADACQRLAMKRKNERWPQFEKTSFQRVLNRRYAGIILPKDVPCLGFGSRLRVRDELRL